ncbi:bifunctional phosphopantothenoylcysteine decarboxylase/phosphopantothenate--cysteine ligase CoaBC [Gracilimonas sp.]|uniref:bifunctional phosphopantothenoylcysteine decarboxylase/phosphopantothenate--cysteine ligase CoaBC n=1 Tax=Gracilimonas sp. TaxID=1974203 RepID=UPI002871CDD4|nr:bifunctional phosphopantothenoylcysteine decarboxylase/phosphopantothenate--cysteine ligase CoaBC [Gracilimonas sp.]
MLSGKRIILGVTGGIAAYKAAFLLREFQKAGAEVRVTMTPSATRFVGLETFASLSGHEVAVEIFPDKPNSGDWTRHINWGEWADLFVIAPCTANTLAKITTGISDNMLTSTVLAARCPVLLCPTMDGEMYDSPGVSRNLDKVKEFGYHILEPESGYLASGLEGKGRLPEIDKILEKASEIIGSVKGPLEGKKVVVTAGPTREHIDPVRFISNPSSGKMGVAIAEAAQSLGADVTLIHGPLSIAKPDGIHSVSITSTGDLFEVVKEHADADVIIMAAAVSDFTPVEIHKNKVKKTDAVNSIELERTQDILAWLGEHRKEGQMLIGFAMETENLIENATSKLEKKNADYIIANLLNDKESGFEGDTNTVHLLSKDSDQKFQGTKKDIAIEILNSIFR